MINFFRATFNKKVSLKRNLLNSEACGKLVSNRGKRCKKHNKTAPPVENSVENHARNPVENKIIEVPEGSDYWKYRDKKKSPTNPSKAMRRAVELAEQLNNPAGRNFYLKCAWRLSDTYLDYLLLMSKEKKRPAHYFSKAASDALKNT